MTIGQIRQVRGAGVPLRGDSIDTDRIIPARFLKAITFDGLEEHLFEDDRRQADAAAPGSHPLSDPRFRGAAILVVNANFGCGSSREHAPQAIRRNGIRAVVGESFSEIFFGNAVALGLPCVTADRAQVRQLMARIEANPSLELVVDLDEMTIRAGTERVPIRLPPGARESFLDGTWDATALLLDRYEEVEGTMRRLPYIRGFEGQ